ncbi:MAG: 2-oxo-4-hydroxy-4-carboxy-5-ureidoimidazoline decarboxylase [Geodermatophilaceae bacterium]
MGGHSLDWFNALPIDEVTAHLRVCNAADRFASEIAARRPYASKHELVETAEAVSLGLSWAEVSQVVGGHPRIGDRPKGESQEARSSRAEQASMASAEDDVRMALAEGNARYEARFGHGYLIRAAGRTPREILAELQRRLGNDPTSERVEVTRQLAEITRLRVERLITP